METTRRELADWAIRKIESEYRDDVCLLAEHNTLRLKTDPAETSFSFYIPATSRGGALARTFIINGIGHDLFPVSWERVERFADIKEYNTTLIADATILYSRTDDDRKRFESLQAKLRANLQNPHYMYRRALDWLDAAVEAFREMLFEDKLYIVRENAGHICDMLSICVAFINQQYFRHGQTDQIEVLQSMDKIPEGFAELYERIIRAKTAEEQNRLCHEMIASTKAFAAKHDRCVRKTGTPDFAELASWYQELSYTWRRVYHFCDANDPVNAHIWCCLLQDEVEELGSEFGIAERDILGAFDAENLSALRGRAGQVEQRFVAAIEANGVTIDSYPSVEEFLKRNP